MKKFYCILYSIIICIVLSPKTYAFDIEKSYQVSVAPNTIGLSEVKNLALDNDQLLWIATTDGLRAYNGYTMKTYKSTAYTPNILPNNRVLCTATDKNNNVWMGTYNGICRLDKKTGHTHFYIFEEGIIYTMASTSDGSVWAGSDGGLMKYNSESDSFEYYNSKNSTYINPDGEKRSMPNYSVKDIVEDTNGDIFLGTWSSGLLLLKKGTHQFFAYQQLNRLNSAFSLLLDSNHHLWIGTWGYGLLRMDNPRNTKDPQLKKVVSENELPCRLFMTLEEEKKSRTVWAGTENGILVGLIDSPDQLDYSERLWDGSYENFGEISDIKADEFGNIWMGCAQNRLFKANSIESPFSYTEFKPTDDVRRFIGSTILAYTKDKKGRTWQSALGAGMALHKGNEFFQLINNNTTNYIIDNTINSLFCDKNGRIWIGQRYGLSLATDYDKGDSLMLSDEKENFNYPDVKGISQDRKGRIWLCTENYGILRVDNPSKIKVKGGQTQRIKVKCYSKTKGNMPVADALKVHEDSKGHIWTISASGGLMKYNKQTDKFVPVNKEYNILSDKILSINEDINGDIWLACPEGLCRLHFNKDKEKPEVFNFTKADGLTDLSFVDNLTYTANDTVFFGTRHQWLAFSADSWADKNSTTKSPYPLIITDIIINDTHYSELDSAKRAKISPDTPYSTRRIVLPSKTEKITIEFALLSYDDAEQKDYMYMLEMYDNDWRHCETATHSAIYENLPAGTYNFRLKARDRNGMWTELPYTITLIKEPPFYATWWAYLIYSLMAVALIWVLVKWYKTRIQTKNRLMMAEIFTNITHELLTPLSIISATTDNLRDREPQHESEYSLIQNNIKRLVRQLRNILEIRKQQAGKLKLEVVRTNISNFIKNECNNIIPLMERKSISFNKNIEDGIEGYIDTDKLDKILYNLLSNSVKYTPEKGNINVTLTKEKKDNGWLVMAVEDNGIGISETKLQNLYQKYMDGDYRKVNAMGTGLGLSLTFELVKLHKGTIQCDSKEGKGTKFTISLPIDKFNYDDEIVTNDTILNDLSKMEDSPKEKINIASDDDKQENDEQQKANSLYGYNILIVEDNTELLSLMKKLLSKKYHVETASNGLEAWEKISRGEELDIVVTDYMMPLMNGLELTKRIKNSAEYGALPVVMLTAKTQSDDRNDAFVAGADEYIIKPFNLQELQIRIDNIISNRERIRKIFTSNIVVQNTNNTAASGTDNTNEDISSSNIANIEPADSQEKEEIVNIELSEERKDNNIYISITSSDYTDEDKNFLQKALEMVNKHLADTDFNREVFASEMGVSESTLYNRIKALTGMNVSSFISSIRIKAAAKILSDNPSIRVSDLAYSVGFAVPKYFSTLFKKEYGMLVSEYAKQNNTNQE